MVPGGAPDNPLGTRALYLSWQYHRIHGTQDTRKIGRRSSNGCIGMYNEHVQELFAMAKVGTQVLLIQGGRQEFWNDRGGNTPPLVFSLRKSCPKTG